MLDGSPVGIEVPGGPRLEGRLATGPEPRGGMVICHPHPLYGGDMDNPVVVTVAGAAFDSGLATLRFNFRGVGASGGRHDEGRGELDDARAARGFLSARLPPGATVSVAGYSFGAWVATRIARPDDAMPLALIAPPLAMVDCPPPPAGTRPVLIVVGTQDVYCPLSAVDSFVAGRPDAEIVRVAGADHFFSGSLERVREAVARWVRQAPARASGGPARQPRGRGGAG